MNSKQNTYFLELCTVLQQEDYTILPEQDGCLPVSWKDRPLCQITIGGSIRFRTEDILDPDTGVALAQVKNIAAVVKEYITLLEEATDLKADSLHEPYKLLAEFNDTVLAGRFSDQYGGQFVTWRWNRGKTSLCYGHYFNHDYVAAKQEFCTRSGLIDQNRVFSDEQLTEIYHCVREVLMGRYPTDQGQEKLLEKMEEQIRDAIPNLTGKIAQLKEGAIKMEVYRGMTPKM
jgi:hypothetical protein